MEKANQGTRVLLGVFAHPDDEAYGPGGTLARCAIEGIDVRLLLFTCGEAGTIGISKHLAREDLCRRRRAELAASCEALGVTDHRVLGLPDRRLSETPLDEGARLVLEEIRTLRPHVVVTFHREGVSGHPDHIAVNRFTHEAFRRAGPEGPLKLYEWGVPRFRAPLYRERRLFPIGDSEITTVVSVPSGAMDRKIEAIRRHETQIEFYHELLRLFGDYREATADEFFVLAASRMPRRTGTETHLFEGIQNA